MLSFVLVRLVVVRFFGAERKPNIEPQIPPARLVNVVMFFLRKITNALSPSETLIGQTEHT